MAQRVLTVTTCDIDGEGVDSDGSHLISVDGKTWRVDLCEGHRLGLEETLAPYLRVGRLQPSRGRRRPVRRQTGPRTPGRPTVQPKVSPAVGSVDEIRSWAKANGYAVADRGRIAGTVRDAYLAANR